MTQSDVCNDSYVTIADTWSTGELVEALRLLTFDQKREEILKPSDSGPPLP